MASAVGAAIGAVGTGVGLFNYNKQNYLFDVELRWERYLSGFEYGITQCNMYRNDLRKFTELSMKKAFQYGDTAALCLALCIALYCAGRLGLHGASPPGWIIVLWYGNNAAAFCYMITCIWLCFHMSFRAQCAAVHLLSRKVRLPIPRLKDLDKARRFSSEFEQEDWVDILRVPYICGPGVPETDNLNLKPEGNPRAHSAPPGERRGRGKGSSWNREEWSSDKAGIVTGNSPAVSEALSQQPEDIAPEHFRLYAQVQKEWWAYDVYARICLFYGFLSFTHGLAYYSLGHINVEARAWWVAYSCCFLLCCLHAALCRFDIVNGRRKEMLPFAQYAGSIAPMVATIAMSLDFRVEFIPASVDVCFVLQFIAYFLQLVYQLRLLEIIYPDDAQSRRPDDTLGESWWPSTWNIPSTFQHVFYLVAPPCRLQPGQGDIVAELKHGTQPQRTGPGDADAQSMRAQQMQQELQGQVMEVDNYFEWAFRKDVFDETLSPSNQQKVQELYKRFQAAKAKANSAKPMDANTIQGLKRSCEECYSGLEEVARGSDLQPSGSEGGMSPRSAGGDSPSLDTRRLHRNSPDWAGMKHVQPWKLVWYLTAAVCSGWVIGLIGLLVEVIVGEQGLVTAPHWSRPPMTRPSKLPHELGTPIGGSRPAGSTPWLPEHMAWHEEKREADWRLIAQAGMAQKDMKDAYQRRLGVTSSGKAVSAPVPWLGEMPGLRAVLDSLPDEEGANALLGRPLTEDEKLTLAKAHARAGKSTDKGHVVAPEQASWPSFFEPQVLACGSHGKVAAIAKRGFGAVLQMGFRQGQNTTEVFRLAGLGNLPPLMGASWSHKDDELLLVTREGHLVSCAGPRPAPGGAWACQPLANAPSMLPLPEKSELLAAAAAWLPGSAGSAPQLHAAYVDKSAPGVVAIFVLESDGESASWTPFGELRVPGRAAGATARLALSFVDGRDLLVATERGEVLRRSLVDGAAVPTGLLSRVDRGTHGAGTRAVWHSACGLHNVDGGVAHLHLVQAGASGGWRPEVVAVGNRGAVKMLDEPIFE